MACLLMPAKSANSLRREPSSAKWRVMWMWAALIWSRAAKLDNAKGTSTLCAIRYKTRASKRRMAWPSKRPKCSWRQSGCSVSFMDSLY